MTRPYPSALVVLLLVPLVGCGPLLVVGAAGTVGSGAYIWYRGWVQQTLDVPHDRAYRAARAALDDVDVALEDETLGKEAGVLDGYARDSKRVMVKTKAIGETATQVRIRVGLWGDQERSLKILDQMKKHL